MKTIQLILIAAIMAAGIAESAAQEKKPATPPGKAVAAAAKAKNAEKAAEKAAGKAEEVKGKAEEAKEKGAAKAEEAKGKAEEAVQMKKPASPPAKAEGTIDGVKVTIDYSAPSARGRKIMGGLVPFGKVWRTGANATTTIQFSGDVKIGDKSVAKGKYGLYTIPGESDWTIMISKSIKWGADDYTAAEDVARVTVPAGKTSAFVETFTISVENGQVVLKWENTQAAFSVTKG